MNEASRLALRKALRKLREADAIDVEHAPGAIVHSSYYSMLHGAKAYILEHSTFEPRKHDAIIGEFCRLLKDTSDESKEHGRAVNRARTLRNADDYDPVEDVPAEEATVTREEARALFLFVAAAIGTSEAELDGNTPLRLSGDDGSR